MKNSWDMQKFSANKIKENIDNGLFVVPRYQRGIVWSDKQRADLMDTIKKGLPFGTILLYKDDSGKYQIIDGLQRSTAIQKFGENPTQFFEYEDIDDEAIGRIVEMIGAGGNKRAQAEIVKQELCEWVKNDHKTLDDVEHMQFSKFGQKLSAQFPSLSTYIVDIGDLIEPMMKNYQDICKHISDTDIPAIVLEGDPDLLPILFERINTKGLQLSKYQIFNATWPDKKYTIKDDYISLVQANRNRYDSMLDGDAVLDDYDSASFLHEKKLSVFEIAFGLGKYLCDRWPHLFGSSKDENAVESVGFNLLCTCLCLKNSDAKSLGTKFDELIGDEVNALLKDLTECVEFVNKRIGKYSAFKSNSRNDAGKRPLHSEFQIVAIVSSVFLMKYVDIELDDNDRVKSVNIHLNTVNSTWGATNKKLFEKNVGKIYITEVLDSKWKGSGDHKLDAVLITPNMYAKKVSKEDFEQTMDNWFARLNEERGEIAKVANPKDPELLMIAAVYLSVFTAGMHLDDSKYDIEHLATKKLMKKHLERFDSTLRLPISSFGNLCLLPEFENRSKGEATIYMDNGYLEKSKYTLDDLEEKYTFTTREQMDWLSDMKSTPEEFKNSYFDFINTRYKAMKEKVIDNFDKI